MGLITDAKNSSKPQTSLNFPVFTQDFFVILRLALENTPWQPDDLPMVKKTAGDLKLLLEFTEKVKKAKQVPPQVPPEKPVDAVTPPEKPVESSLPTPNPADPNPTPEEKSEPPKVPVEKKN